MSGPRLQPMVRQRLAGLGPAGAAWQAGLDGLLAALERRWGITVERRSLPGGSGSLVAPATTAAGEPRVVKVVVPGEGVAEALAQEARVLGAAEGRGYARLHAYDTELGALLLDRLGRSREQTPGAPEAVLTDLATTLREAWGTDPSVAPHPEPGEDKGSTLHALVSRLAERLGRTGAADALDPRALALALEYAGRRAAAHDPADCVVVHGDPHAGNLLRDERSPTGWSYVDPDGFAADPAYDVGVALRDFSGALLALDPATARATLEHWCALAADLTGTDPQAVWEWAYVERVSTGLYVTDFGAARVGAPFLRTAGHLLG